MGVVGFYFELFGLVVLVDFVEDVFYVLFVEFGMFLVVDQVFEQIVVVDFWIVVMDVYVGLVWLVGDWVVGFEQG